MNNEAELLTWRLLVPFYSVFKLGVSLAVTLSITLKRHLGIIALNTSLP